MQIRYPLRSKFLASMESQIRAHKAELLKAQPVTVNVRNVARENGYEGNVLVEITPQNKDRFLTDWKSSDPSRFPQRIRVAAWVMHRNRIYGNFRVSHRLGILTINKI